MFDAVGNLLGQESRDLSWIQFRISLTVEFQQITLTSV